MLVAYLQRKKMGAESSEVCEVVYEGDVRVDYHVIQPVALPQCEQILVQNRIRNYLAVRNGDVQHPVFPQPAFASG